MFLGLGGLLGCAAPGVGWWPLAWLGLVPAFYGLQFRPRWRAVVVNGFCFGFGYHLVWFGWFPSLHPMGWLGFSPWQSMLVAYGAWLLISAVGGALFMVLGCVYKAMNARLHWGVITIVFPWVWISLFYLWGRFDLFIPWALIEYTQSNNPMGWLSHPFWIVAYNHLIAVLLYQGGSKLVLLKDRLYRAVIAASLPAFLIIASVIMPSKQASSPFFFPVVIVEGNLPIDVIRSEAALDRVAETTYLKPLSTMTLQPNTLVILPEEGVITGLVSGQCPESNETVHRLQRLANTKNISIAVGASTAWSKNTVAWEWFHNSLMLFTPHQPLQFYHKRDLVVMGEREPNFQGLFPHGWMNTFLSQLGIPYEFAFQPGHPKLITTSFPNYETLSLFPTVCFELVSLKWPFWPQSLKLTPAIGHPPPPSVVINVSNLGWFHDNSLLETQFWAIARYKARNSGMPVIIAANTGPSGVIDGSGRVVAHHASRINSSLILRIDPKPVSPPQ